MSDSDQSDINLDPVDYAVISHSLMAAAREMGVKLVRSSYSTIVREAQDASASLLDREGNVIAQAELIPMQLGPMSDVLRACTNLFSPETLKEGDFYINNDPFLGGQHLQDVFIFSPIFFEDELIGFAGTVSHHLDLGGGNPGMTPDAIDVHAEGLIFPPSLYNFDRDWNGGPLERLIAANIRVPEQTIGDFYGQFAANAVGTERLRQIANKYGIGKLHVAMQEFMNYSERRFRLAISDIPDGVYFGEDAVDDDGVGDEPLRVKARVEVSGDSISVDFTGSCKQIQRNLNCPWTSTISATFSALKSTFLASDTPFNEGLKRPVTISAPLGTIVNPRYPAPVRARMLVAYRCFNAILKALAEAVPERVVAGGNDTTHSLAFSKLRHDSYSVYIEIYGGGFGAAIDQDGCSAVDSILSNCTNTPIEAMDIDFDHLRVIGYGLIPDSGGAGRHRGGLGFFRRFEMLEDGINFTSYSDRMKLPSYAMANGLSGAPARIELLRDGTLTTIASKKLFNLIKGDVVTLYTAGGSGYGNPHDRDRRAVADDLHNGMISAQSAKNTYGLSE